MDSFASTLPARLQLCPSALAAALCAAKLSAAAFCAAASKTLPTRLPSSLAAAKLSATAFRQDKPNLATAKLSAASRLRTFLQDKPRLATARIAMRRSPSGRPFDEPRSLSFDEPRSLWPLWLGLWLDEPRSLWPRALAALSAVDWTVAADPDRTCGAAASSGVAAHCGPAVAEPAWGGSSPRSQPERGGSSPRGPHNLRLPRSLHPTSSCPRRPTPHPNQASPRPTHQKKKQTNHWMIYHAPRRAPRLRSQRQSGLLRAMGEVGEAWPHRGSLRKRYRLGQQLIVRTNYVINVIIVLGLNIRNRRFPWTKFPGLNNSNRRFAATRVGP